MSRTDKKFEELESVMRRAGDILLELWPGQNRSRPLKKHRKKDGSLVTEADFASHDLITTKLKELFPGDFILSEEDVDADGYARADSAWILDPLDGTEVFARGEDYFAIFLARRIAAEVTAGFMYYPARGELYSAFRGEGAFKNGSRMQVSNNSAALGPGAIFAEGFSELPDPVLCSDKSYPVSTNAFLGVCQGQIDGVVIKFERGYFYPWDFAPGFLMIEESGGKVVTLPNQLAPMSTASVSSSFIVASNGALHDKVLAIIPPN